MEVSAANHGAVVQVGCNRVRPAGKEEEYKGAAAAVPACNGGKRRDRIVIGLGVPRSGAGVGSALPGDPGTVARSAGR